MRFGLLRLTLPGGKRQDFPLEQPTVVIGRASDNDLIVEESSVSRRHARLTVDSGRLMVEDLGSANGSYLGGQRLAANTPSLLADGQVLRLGDVRIEYDLPAPVEAAEAFAPPPAAAPSIVPSVPGGPAINAALSGPTQPVPPGSLATATLTLHNRGTVVDEFALSVSGLPPEWVKFSQERVPLLPNAQQAVTLSFQPPRRAEATAGEHAFTVIVSAKEQGVSQALDGRLSVLPFQQLGLSLQPVRAKRDFQVQLHNLGNTPVALSLTGRDDEAALDYRFGMARIDLGPGESRGVPLQVLRRQRAGLGTRETRSFNISAVSADASQPEAKTAGQLLVQSNFPLWIIPVLLLLVLCACVGGVFGYATLCPSLAPSAPLCPSQGAPVITLFTVTPTEVAAGGTVVVAWDVSGAETVELTLPFQNTLASSGTQSFVVAEDTVFTLHASNPFGGRDSSVQVKVLKPSPTPTVTRPADRPPTDTPSAPATVTPTPLPAEPSTPTPRPTPNGALGIFESQFTVVVDLIFGGSLGSQRVCTPHPLTLGPADVGKVLTVNVLDFFAGAGASTPAPTPSSPTAGLYHSDTGPWVNGQSVNLWDAPNAEQIAPAAAPLKWTITAAGDYEVCLEVSANDYYNSGLTWSYVRYQVLLSGQ